jgi:hypothetical protein
VGIITATRITPSAALLRSQIRTAASILAQAVFRRHSRLIRATPLPTPRSLASAQVTMQASIHRLLRPSTSPQTQATRSPPVRPTRPQRQMAREAQALSSVELPHNHSLRHPRIPLAVSHKIVPRRPLRGACLVRPRLLLRRASLRVICSAQAVRLKAPPLARAMRLKATSSEPRAVPPKATFLVRAMRLKALPSAPQAVRLRVTSLVRAVRRLRATCSVRVIHLKTTPLTIPVRTRTHPPRRHLEHRRSHPSNLASAHRQLQPPALPHRVRLRAQERSTS